jgi:hypothetical protein
VARVVEATTSTPGETTKPQQGTRKHAGPNAGRTAESADEVANPADLLALADQNKDVGTAKPEAAVPAKPAVAEGGDKVEAAAAEPPETLSRTMIHRGFSAVKSKVLKCRDQAPEATMVEATVVIAPDGTVEDAQIEGALATSSAAPCFQNAIKTARFPEVKNAQTVTYPFSLK